MPSLRPSPLGRAAALLCLVSSLGCLAETVPRAASPPADLPPLSLEPSAPVLRRLTQRQYANTVADLLGDGLVISGPLEPDQPFAGLLEVGASQATISTWGVEQYEASAFDLAAQALRSPEARSRLVPCDPSEAADLSCARRFVTELGRRAFRRPLEDEEIAALARTATTGASVLGELDAGLELALAAILQSPSFLFRVELGEPDPDRPGERRLTAFELATRLSYFLLNTTPDDALLEAAARGDLHEDGGLRKQAERLLASPGLREGIRSFFRQLLELDQLDRLSKDPTIFPHFTAELGATAREETLRLIDDLLIDGAGDYRSLLTAEYTFADRRLAAIYGVRATAREGFGRVVLPREGDRRGLLGQVSFLALHAHPVSSSATKRGKFVRQVLLCGDIPAPPVNVNTALPEPSAAAPTLRERIGAHLTNDACAGCHLQMDPIGLGLERFDGIGRLRSQENGGPIDPRADLDGAQYPDAWSLAEGVSSHPDLPRCLVRNLYRYATGQIESERGRADLLSMVDRFAGAGYRVKPLLLEIVLSAGFRRSQEVQ